MTIAIESTVPLSRVNSKWEAGDEKHFYILCPGDEGFGIQIGSSLCCMRDWEAVLGIRVCHLSLRLLDVQSHGKIGGIYSRVSFKSGEASLLLSGYCKRTLPYLLN